MEVPISFLIVNILNLPQYQHSYFRDVFAVIHEPTQKTSSPPETQCILGFIPDAIEIFFLTFTFVFCKPKLQRLQDRDYEKDRFLILLITPWVYPKQKSRASAESHIGSRACKLQLSSSTFPSP